MGLENRGFTQYQKSCKEIIPSKELDVQVKSNEKGIITEYNEYCLFCGRPVEAKHHLIGGPNRKKAEEDELKIPCCNNCHNIGDVLTRIHGNPMAEMMSKMMGQLAWEKRAVAGGKTEKEAREAFRSRYGISYL